MVLFLSGQKFDLGKRLVVVIFNSLPQFEMKGKYLTNSWLPKPRRTLPAAAASVRSRGTRRAGGWPAPRRRGGLPRGSTPPPAADRLCTRLSCGTD